MTDPEQDNEEKADEQPSGKADDRPPLPEPSLKTFISAMAGQVLINLGLFENPGSGKREQNLEQAKYTIDLLQILLDKMHGNLGEEERKLFESALYDLRMRYVQACR